MNRDDLWHLWIDTGGTFTDCLAVDPSARTHRAKVLSSGVLRARIVERLSPTALRIEANWPWRAGVLTGMRLQGPTRSRTIIADDPAAKSITLDHPLDDHADSIECFADEEAPILAARLLTGTPLDRPLPPIAMRLGTTRGTNALLERRGARVAFFVTRGFGDLLRIGTQQRPDLFALNIVRPEPVYESVVEVPERIAADGRILTPLDLDALQEPMRRLLDDDVRVVAIALKNSHVNAEHEIALATHLRAAGFAHVIRSAEIAPFIRLLPRAETAVVEAYLAPILREYLDRIEAALHGGSLMVMNSTGGLIASQSFRAVDGLLSGPAGGVAGAAHAGRTGGHNRLIAFDMGGTSTDVARFDGDFEYIFEHTVGDAHLLAPALAIETVAAGGGSVCWFDGHRLRVGPHSAGASPGPACYGAGGPLTLTDVNLLLGRLDASRFQVPIHPADAERRFEELRREIDAATGSPSQRETLLAGWIDIADERMADAIRRISVRRGYDPAEYALVAFGGAGGQHACAVASHLGMRTIVVPRDAGLLSAVGIGHAPIERFAQRQVLEALRNLGDEGVEAIINELAVEAMERVRFDLSEDAQIEVRRRLVNLRLQGQDSTITVEHDALRRVAELFEEAYERLYGYRTPDVEIEIESIRVVASAMLAAGEVFDDGDAADASETILPRRVIDGWFAGRSWRTPVLARESLPIGAAIDGPALIVDDYCTTVVADGWCASVDEVGSMVLTPNTTDLHIAKPTSGSKAVQLELFTNRFRAIVAEMGELLRRTAQSTNVKERLDFSCALLDAEGRLIVNAPHIPVHLGAMGLCVRTVVRASGRYGVHRRDACTTGMCEGDTIITNHPGFGGSHLPDVTLITPVFHDGQMLGWVANRAHHAEIGGSRPGSMPPDATTLAEEGVVIGPMHLAREGRVDWGSIRELLSSGPHPSRSVEMNLADLAAALAANRRGAEMLKQLAAQHGRATVEHYMDAITRQAEDRLRAAIQRMTPGRHHAIEFLDDGTQLEAAITIHGAAQAPPLNTATTIDFGGTSPVHAGNLNATPAIVHSAVIYVLRLLVNEAIPLNEGLLRPVEIIIPTGTLLNPMFDVDPARCPAVVGGNVETSQRLVDTLLKALANAHGLEAHAPACSQGTMNNVLFGTDVFGYYETICGGAGATADADGADAVHTHMTNTRITDPEIIEHRYPVRVERFAIRRGSGGRGEHRGGDGAVREIVFDAPMSLSVLTQHRVERPYGIDGGEPGQPGSQRIIRATGETVELGPIDCCEVRPGDRFIIKTPGGGGWGMRQ